MKPTAETPGALLLLSFAFMPAGAQVSRISALHPVTISVTPIHLPRADVLLPAIIQPAMKLEAPISSYGSVVLAGHATEISPNERVAALQRAFSEAGADSANTSNDEARNLADRRFRALTGESVTEATALEAAPTDVQTTAPAPTSRRRLQLNRGGQSYLERYTRSYAEQRYGSAIGPRALSRLEQLGPRFKALIADPGLVIRLRQFESFVKSRRLGDMDPWLVREKFSNSLGDRVVYRALTLTEAEHRAILKHGMKSTHSLQEDDVHPSDYASNLQGELLRKLSQGSGSFFLSVADRPNVAKAAAAAFLYKFRRPLLGWFDPRRRSDTNIYLFTIQVPELDIVFPEVGNPHNPMQTSLVESQLVIHAPNGDRQEYPYDRSVESMILYEIGPEEIVRSEPVSGRYSYEFK